jgi:hypothetical protein
MPSHRKTSLVILCALAAILVWGGQSAGQETARATAVSGENPAASADTENRPLPGVQEILKKYEAASGGREAWSSFTTRSLKGIYQTEDESSFAAIETFNESPDKSFTKIAFPNGLTVREICDGKSAWLEDPRGGIHEFTGAVLESRVRSANFNGRAAALLMALTGRVLGIAQVGPHSAYIVEFTADKKTTSKIYFDITSGFAVRVDDAFHRDEGDYTVVTYLDDYRPIEGAYFPFRIRHVEKGNVFTVRVTQIKKNPPVDESIFLKPGVVSAR